MTEPSWSEIERHFLAALELESSEVEAYLDEACKGNEGLRRRVEQLLDSHRQLNSDFLEPASPEPNAPTPLPSDEPAFGSSEVLGKYRILRKVGEGGMASVYLATHLDLEHQVALKVLPRFATSSEERVARFKREAVTLAKLRHPAIVSVHDVGEERGVHYLVMDYISGPTLSQFLTEARAQDIAQGGKHKSSRDFVRGLCDWMAQIAEALHHAHEAGIVHRDVKPSNILLRGGLEPLLTDFGVAKNLLEPSQTETGQLAGTAPYMSPEQARAARNTIDPRSDVFSLGTVLYEALSLRQPFRGETLEESLKNVLFKIPPKVDQWNGSVPRDLVTVVHKALEKEPQHRYSTAAHMAGDLRSFLAGRPILASPPSLARRGREYLRRHRVAALVLASVLLACSLGGVSWYTHKQVRAGQGRLVIEAGAAGHSVWLQELDEQARHFGERRLAGETPLETHLEPGHYRMTVVNSRGSLREASVLIAAGEDRRLDLDFESIPDRTAEMVLVEGGQTREGVPLDSFYLDRFEVSNDDYRRFLRATGHPEPELWRRFGFPQGRAGHPIVGLTWFDCQAFALWSGCRLPTSAEWQFAMSRPDGRRTPWRDGQGPAFEPPTSDSIEAVRSAEMDRSYASYLAGAQSVQEDVLPTPLGFHHAAGNAREFTDTTREGSAVAVRGASWLRDPRDLHFFDEGLAPLRTRSTEGEVRAAWSVEIGFRCARSAAVVQ